MSFASADSLPTCAEVVVVGGGVNGCSTAFQLSRRGIADVVVVERAQLCSGATGKSGALVRAHYSNAPETQLALESMKIFRNWQAEVGFGDPGFQTPGFLRVVYPDDEANLRANVEMQRSLGGNTTIVTPEEISEIEPLMFTGDLTVAAWEPDSGFADPVATTLGFAAAASAAGTKFFPFTEASAVEVDGQGVCAVRTSRGRIATRTVVLAAGAYVNPLLDDLGLGLQMVPYRTQVVIFRWPPEIDQQRQHSVVIDSTNHSWFRPEGRNGTLIGCETGENRTTDPHSCPETLEQAYIEEARVCLSARFPAFRHALMRGGWTGVFLNSPDDHPIIDQPPAVPGLYLMTGDNGSSFKTAPAIGICLAEWIVGGRAQLVDLTPFRHSRFAEGEPWVDEHAYQRAASSTVSR